MKKLTLGFYLICVLFASAQTPYQLPPNEIAELADVGAPPQPLVSRSNQWMLLLERPMYKTLEELASAELKLAGLRINPNNFDVSRGAYYTSFSLQQMQTGKKVNLINLPEDGQIKNVQFSPRENYISFIWVEAQKIGLWLVDVKTGIAKEILTEGISNTMGAPYTWSNDERIIYCRYIGERKPMAAAVELPKGPSTQDATGVKAAARTYQDLLRNENDEQRFEHYTRCEIVKVNVAGVVEPFLPEAIYKRFSPSPGENYFLTETVKRPYSYTLPYGFFASEFSVYDATGHKVTVIEKRPLQDKLPTNFDAVESGKRNIMWRNDKAASLIWCVAPDGGNPANIAEFRDELFECVSPFIMTTAICKIKNRFSNIVFSSDRLAIVEDYWWKNRNTKTYLIQPGFPAVSPKVITDRSNEDIYSDPGDFVTGVNEFNREVLLLSKDGKKCYRSGEGCSPEGNKPFIDEVDIATIQHKRLWRADGKSTYERIVRVMDIEKKQLLTSIESPKVYPNLYIRNMSGGKPQQITFRQNPYKSLTQVSKQKIFYKRKDGVQLSATLYLPAGYDHAKNGRLPMLMEAYPTEFKDDKAAGQVKESPHTFVSINWASPVFWVTRGYAILEDAQFPIIGKGSEEPNDTYIEQLVADAEAAIDAVEKMGVVDKKRVAVMGHSYGAFMTANLLIHSNLFAGGIARSGAYNRTLTPFGFQSEERNFWQAKEVYSRMSPFNYADQFKAPILLIHGDADNNPGTFTLQSERLFQAIKGNGGTARLVLLPYESHGYAAKENIFHMLWEMDSWLEKYVKNNK